MTEGLAERYAAWRASPLGAITERIERAVVFELAGPIAARRALDVGAGDGAYAIEAARRGARVTGVDTDPAMLKAARARAAGVTVELVAGRVEALPFPDGSFDLVFAITLLCLVQDPEAAVRELARVLRPGGRLVLGELARWSAWAATRRVRGWLGARSTPIAHSWSPRALARLVAGVGLAVVSERRAVFYPPIGLAARLLAPVDPLLTRLHGPGAAFLALAADKPRGPS